MHWRGPVRPPLSAMARGRGGRRSSPGTKRVMRPQGAATPPTCTAAVFSKKLRRPKPLSHSSQYSSGTSCPPMSGNSLYARPASMPARPRKRPAAHKHTAPQHRQATRRSLASAPAPRALARSTWTRGRSPVPKRPQEAAGAGRPTTPADWPKRAWRTGRPPLAWLTGDKGAAGRRDGHQRRKGQHVAPHARGGALRRRGQLPRQRRRRAAARPHIRQPTTPRHAAVSAARHKGRHRTRAHEQRSAAVPPSAPQHTPLPLTRGRAPSR